MNPCADRDFLFSCSNRKTRFRPKNKPKRVHSGNSLLELFQARGTEAQCEAALEEARWPHGFRCPCCGGAAHCVLRVKARKTFQCNRCHHQTSLIAGTLFEGTKLPLTVWFLAMYLISQAKSGLSALALKRALGVSYPTAWLMHHKLMQAMVEREAGYRLTGTVQLDDAYLGGELSDGTVGRGSANKVPFLAAVSVNEQGHPLRAKFAQLPGFTRKAIAAWASETLCPGTTVRCDGLACFAGVTTGRTMPSTSPSTPSAILGAITYRFNRRFDLHALPGRLLAAAVATGPRPERRIRMADTPC